MSGSGIKSDCGDRAIMWQQDGITIHQGDCLAILSTLPAGSVNCCVTSPPYWGLRDYGTAAWDGGDTACDHKKVGRTQNMDKLGERLGCGGGHTVSDNVLEPYKHICGKCGAKRIDQQLGLEATPEEYIEKMVHVFREVRRVMRGDGTLWVNIGDSYYGGKGASNYNFQWRRVSDSIHGDQHNVEASIGGMRPLDAPQDGLKPKDLVGIPWMLAFALRADGWYLRSEIIWHKPNPMPESVTDRPTKSHEQIFLFAKSQKYYYDSAAIKEPASYAGQDRGGSQNRYEQNSAGMDNKQYDTRNKRSVWTVPVKPYKGAHFATFPPELIEPCILAGCPEGGVIIDPFAGSGTTAQVAQKNGCKFVGCELNPEYIELIKKRFSQRSFLLEVER